MAVVAVRHKRRRRTLREIGRDIRRNWTAYLFISPGLVFLFICSIYTMSVALWLSFHPWDIIEPAHPYVWWANYHQAFHSADCWSARLNTFIMSLGIPVLM